jgi:hypothetical protein
MSEKETNVSWSEESTLVGIPTMALMPAKNFYFKVLDAKHKITLKREGAFADLDSDFFSKDDGSFIIVNDDKTVINIANITKVLFGSSKYADLKENQLFCPISVVINKDTVDIFGQVVDMLEPPNGMTVEE